MQPKRLLVPIELAISGLVLVWLGYAIGRTQSIGQVAGLERNADVDRYLIARSGTVLDFERLGGDAKPYLRTAAGQPLLDFSDWNPSSRIIVDGTEYELARVYPSSAVDYQRYRVAETLHGTEWELEREATVQSDGSIVVNQYFIARKSIQYVDLAVVESASGFSVEGLQDRLVTATANSYRLDIQAGNGLRFRADESTAGGPGRSFIAESTILDPRTDSRTSLGSETVHITHIA